MDNSKLKKVKALMVFPFMALWTAITGDTGSSALFINDVTKDNKEVSEREMRDMTN